MNLKTKGVAYLLLTLATLIISSLSIWFIYQYFGDKNLFLSLGFLTVPVLLKVIALLIVYYLFDTLRFLYILKTLGIQIPFWYMVKLAFINIFISNITPMATGGGFVQIYFLSKKNVPVGDATAASTIRTLIPIVFFFAVTPFVLLSNQTLLRLIPANHSFIYVGALLLICIVVAVILYQCIKDTKIIKKNIYKLLMGLRNRKVISRRRARRMCLSLFREVNGFSKGFQTFVKGGGRNVALSITFSLLYLLALFSFPVLLTNALGYRISPLLIIEIQVVITFITYFAFTPGATGIAEGGFALIFSSIVGKADIVTLTLTWRFFSIYIGVIIGLVIFYIEVIRTSKFKRNRIKKDEGKI